MKSPKLVLISFFTVALAGASVFADEPACLYVVKGNPNAVSPYATWATAAADIATAVAAAKAGDEVVVSNGTYNLTATISIAKAITLRGLTGNPADVVLDGGQKHDASGNPSGNAGVQVMDVTSAAAGFMVHGLTLANGRYTAWRGSSAISIAGAGTLSNCVVRGCYTHYAGAYSMAVYCSADNSLITHCVVTNNRVRAWNKGSNVSGAAVWMASGSRIANSLIGWNGYVDYTPSYGSMLALYETAVAENCTVAGNTSQTGAGIGLYAKDAKAINCVVADNATSSATAEKCCYCVLDKGVAANFINCVFDKYAPNETTCYAGDALTFVDAAAGDYHLTAGSKAIDFGTDEIADTSTADLDGNPRWRSSGAVPKIDAGCYEYQPAAYSVSFSPDKRSSFEPWHVTATAEPEGFDPDDSLFYYWDFDDDGIAEVTTGVKTASYTYTTAGRYDARLVVTNLTRGGAAVASSVFKDFFAANARRLYVVAGNPGASAPYATWATAAANIQTAVGSAAEGAEVIVSNGTYEILSPIAVTVPIILRGLTGRPEDIIVNANKACRILDVNAGTNALIHSMSLRNGFAAATGGGINVYTKGGTVSNLVVSGCCSRGAQSYGPLYFGNDKCRITHCVITNCICTVGGDTGNISGILHLAGGATASHCVVSRCLADENSYKGYGNSAICVENGTAEWCTVVSNEMHAVGGINVTGMGSFRYCLIAGNTSQFFADDRHAVWGALDIYPKGAASFNDEARATDPTIVARQQTNVSDRVQVSDTCLYAAGGLDSLLPKFTTHGKFIQGRTSVGLDVVPAAAASDMPATDVYGHPRKIGPGYDLGAVETFHGGLSVIVR